MAINISEFGFVKILNNEKHLLETFKSSSLWIQPPNSCFRIPWQGTSMTAWSGGVYAVCTQRACHIKAGLGQGDGLRSQEGPKTNTQM